MFSEGSEMRSYWSLTSAGRIHVMDGQLVFQGAYPLESVLAGVLSQPIPSKEQEISRFSSSPTCLPSRRAFAISNATARMTGRGISRVGAADTDDAASNPSASREVSHSMLPGERRN